MGKCSGRCTLVAFCCLQLVSASLPGGRSRVGRGGAGSLGARVGAVSLRVCLVRVPGWGVVWSRGADGRSQLLLAVLSLCVRSSPALPGPGVRPVRQSPARPAPGAPRVRPPVARCAMGLEPAGAGDVTGAGLWVRCYPCRVFS